MSGYNPNIPNPGDFLSSSQPQIKGNFQALDNIFFKNHFKFSDQTGNAGKHRFIELVNGTKPPGVAGESLLYSKQVGSKAVLFYSNDATGQEYQLTTPSGSGYPLFGANSNYQAAGGGNAKVTGGWTFLAGGLNGGLILNYGAATTLNAGGTITVKFAQPFPTSIYNVVVTPRTTTAIHQGDHDWDVGNLTTTSFDLTINGGYVNSDTFYFNAIGN